ncbi:unnamed protein product [Phytophthora lilii]|uniref:Unnamed protein product n=1 Tax=Phytophthora lilii TaxID=2077276 RepID=A0A9W6WV48_9STRA|nr:unnamed protein product [Phytophthora lilii]
MDIVITAGRALQKILELRRSIRRQARENEQTYLRLTELHVELQILEREGFFKDSDTLGRLNTFQKFEEVVFKFLRYLQKYAGMRRFVRILKTHDMKQEREEIVAEIDEIFRMFGLATCASVITAQKNATAFMANLMEMNAGIRLTHDKVQAGLQPLVEKRAERRKSQSMTFCVDRQEGTANSSPTSMVQAATNTVWNQALTPQDSGRDQVADHGAVGDSKPVTMIPSMTGDALVCTQTAVQKHNNDSDMTENAHDKFGIDLNLHSPETIPMSTIVVESSKLGDRDQEMKMSEPTHGQKLPLIDEYQLDNETKTNTTVPSLSEYTHGTHTPCCTRRRSAFFSLPAHDTDNEKLPTTREIVASFSNGDTTAHKVVLPPFTILRYGTTENPTAGYTSGILPFDGRDHCRDTREGTTRLVANSVATAQNDLAGFALGCVLSNNNKMRNTMNSRHFCYKTTNDMSSPLGWILNKSIDQQRALGGCEQRTERSSSLSDQSKSEKGELSLINTGIDRMKQWATQTLECMTEINYTDGVELLDELLHTLVGHETQNQMSPGKTDFLELWSSNRSQLEQISDTLVNLYPDGLGAIQAVGKVALGTRTPLREGGNALGDSLAIPNIGESYQITKQFDNFLLAAMNEGNSSHSIAKAW